MKRKRKYPQDPHWIKAKYRGRCARCGREIKPGARAFYYPTTKELLCEATPCGGEASREFDAMVWDEEHNTCM